MQHSHAGPFGDQKSPTDPDVRPQNPHFKKWACSLCCVGHFAGHSRLDQRRLDVEACRACAGIARFLALEDNVQWGNQAGYRKGSNHLGFGYNRSSYISCEFFIKNPSELLESTTEIKLLADPSPSTSSTQAFNTLKHWIEKCGAEHNGCRNAIPKQLPRRMLEIENIQPLTVRLVETDASGLVGQQRLPYACLSYRWGQQTKMNSLNKANLAIYTHRIPRKRLYPLVKDAIMATWKLDLKYIWIDAYCIVQDNDDEWHREAAMMGDIYENAFITLSATPINNRGRLFSQIRTPQIGYPITEHESRPIFIRRCLEHPRFPRFGQGKSRELVDTVMGQDIFTHQRGWVFQERMLSTRIVHFLRGELFWECRESTWCECRSDEQVWERRRAQVPRTIESMTWAELIQDYCETNFTKEPDRLQALSSVAKRYGEAHGKTYLAGMWFEDLPSTFLWVHAIAPRDLNLRPLDCSDPSWSWTLNCAQKQFPNHTVMLNGHRPEDPSTLDFLGYSRDPPVDNIYADSHSVRLTIAGPTVPGTIFPRDRCVVTLGAVWDLQPDFDMLPKDPSKYRAVEEGSEVLILLCRGTELEDSCLILQSAGIRVSSIDVGNEMFERIGTLSFQMGAKEQLASLSDEVQRCLSSDGVDGQRGSRINGQQFQDKAERRTITLI